MISTAGDALLSVADPSSFATGHLVNGTFSLPQPLQARARNAANTGTALQQRRLLGPPLNLLTYTGRSPTTRSRSASASWSTPTDALRTGAYNKTLTFTLSTTTP